MTAVGDPIGSGIVASPARPGGNVTGPSLLDTDLDSERIELLKEAVERCYQAAAAAVYTDRRFVDAGGLMAYGPSLVDVYRRAATYVDRILKGATPADLPVEQPTKFEFVINRRAARTLGLAIPSSLIARADQVIE
jgi:putative ABC transport system substrate-binding protein